MAGFRAGRLDPDHAGRSAPSGPAPHTVLARATAACAALLEAVACRGRMSLRTRAALAAWVMAALLLAHCGPQDADPGLAELADRL